MQNYRTNLKKTQARKKRGKEQYQERIRNHRSKYQITSKINPDFLCKSSRSISHMTKLSSIYPTPWILPSIMWLLTFTFDWFSLITCSLFREEFVKMHRPQLCPAVPSWAGLSSPLSSVSFLMTSVFSLSLYLCPSRKARCVVIGLYPSQ